MEILLKLASDVLLPAVKHLDTGALPFSSLFKTDVTQIQAPSLTKHSQNSRPHGNTVS